MRSLASRIPPFVLQMIAKEAEREVACGTTPSEDVLISEVKNVVAEIKQPQSVGPRDLIYEVGRQHTNGTIIYLKEHMDRFANSSVEVFGVDQERARSVMQRAYTAVSRLQAAHHRGGEGAPYFEQNIKYVAWEEKSNSEGLASAEGATDAIKTLAFYIKSTYPPKEWYTGEGGAGGASLGLLFGPKRTNPHAKVIYPELKEKAARLVQDLGVFESLIVHDDGLVPEGTRSNYIVVTRDGCVLSSADDDILIGTTLLAVKNQCNALKIPLTSRKLTVRDIVEAEALAMLGTSVNVLPVDTIVLSSEDAGHAAIGELVSRFSKRDEKSFVLTKRSKGNSILRQLNEQYTACTFK